jgi:hypothetical protein
MLRQFLSDGVRVYALQQAKASGNRTPLSLDDLDRLYDQILKGETGNQAGFTDLLIVFDD